MYTIDPTQGDIVIGGFDKGIGDSPYSGLTDMKSVNPDSISGEVSVSLATQSATPTIFNNVAETGTNSTFQTIAFDPALGLKNGQAIYFTASSDHSVLPLNTVYWITGLGSYAPGVCNLSIDYALDANLTIGSNGVTGTFSTFNMALPKFFARANVGNFMIDSSGQVWTDYQALSGGAWRYTGNTLGVGANGNGLVYWRTANSTNIGDWDGWLFIFRNGFIDYCNVDGVSGGTAYNHVGTYTYGWNPLTATTGVTTAYLTGANLSGCPHNGIVGPDGNVYFCDYFTMWKIQQTDVATPVTFLPTTSASFIVSHAHNLPIEEIATCIAPFGDNFIIGGKLNKCYVWNGVDQLTYTTAILLAESYVSNIVTVNTNAYIFCGNRGRIYVTNGSQANAFIKVPDHISGTVEPYFQWGGATYNKGRLYFSFNATTNAGANITGYGGVWAVDLDTKAIWLSNELSYGTYAGYASALAYIPSAFTSGSTLPTVPAGYGLLIGWFDSSAIYGIDTTISTPYTGGQSSIVTELIPVGTALNPTTAYQLEFKVSTPLVSGESVQLLMGSSFYDYINNSFTNVGTISGTAGPYTTPEGANPPILSGNLPVTLQSQQWLIIKAILTSTASSPSYNRITALRVIGGTVKDNVATAPFGTK